MHKYLAYGKQLDWMCDCRFVAQEKKKKNLLVSENVTCGIAPQFFFFFFGLIRATIQATLTVLNTLKIFCLPHTR